MKVETLRLRGTLEGVEVPVVSATVSMSRDRPASCAVQLVPTPLAQMILPRTIFHLFYLDDTVPSALVGTPAAGGTVTQPNLSYEQPTSATGERVVPEVPLDYLRWKLLFVGEVVGLQFVKKRGTRAVVLQCQDLSGYWDSVLHDRRDGLFPPTRMARLQGTAQGSFWDLLGGDTGALYDKLSQPPDAFPEVTGYLGGVMHLMEEVFGTYHRRIEIEGRRGRVIGSQNPFAALAELRLRLLQQVGITPGDSTPISLLRSQGFGSIWRRSVRGLPQQFSFRTLMQALMQYTFYSVFPLTTPRYVPPEGDYATQMGWARLPMSGDVELAASIPTVRQRIDEIVETSKVYAGTSYTPGLTTVTGFDAFLRSVKTVARSLQSSIRASDAIDVRKVKEYLSELAETATQLYARWTRGERVNGDAGRTVNRFGEQIHVAAYEVQKRVLDLEGRRPTSGSDSSHGKPAFLYTQLFRPDIWFCPPPRCNVLFPEMYTSLTMSRSFLAEPTRLMIRAYDGFLGSDAWFDNWYFAPSAVGLLHTRPIVRSGSSVATGDARISNDLMTHELYTGIIPQFQKMSDREMTIGQNILEAGRTEDNVEGQALDYFQRVTNFLFFQSRFANRTVSVDCVFSPQLVPGMPGLVLTSGTDAVNTQLNEEIIQQGEKALQESPDLTDVAKGEILDLLRGRTGVQYLGVVEAITHSLDAAGGGGTSVAVSFARDHRESVELFGQDQVDRERRRRLYRQVVTRQRDVMQGIREGARYGADLASQAAATARTPPPQGALNTPIAPDGSVEGATGEALDVLARMLGGAVGAWAGGVREMLVGREVTRTVAETGAMTKRWTIAAFSEPQIDALGPWGGKLVEVTDITDQFLTLARISPVQQERIDNLNQQIAQMERDVEAYQDRRDAMQANGDLANARTIEAMIVDSENQLAAMRARLSSMYTQSTPSRSRQLSLYGTYPDGRRLPSPSIPAEKIGRPFPASSFGPDVVSYVGDPNALTTLFAYEIVESLADQSEMIDMSLEDIVRPPWYPDIWTNPRIGGGVYLPLLGTGSISDPLAVVSPGTFAGSSRMDAAVAESLLHEGLPPDGSNPELINSILNGATVQGAVDFLVHTYSLLKGQYDITEFARQYTYRPIATMFDLFGSADLRISPDGVIEAGVEGFHSRAFGPYSDLFGLAPADTIKLLGIEEGDVAARARLDVRGRRHAMILAYQQEVVNSRVTSG